MWITGGDHVKRIVYILLLVSVVALLYAAVPLAGVPLDIRTQGTKSARIDYTRFKHSSHAGALKASRKGTMQQLDCAYCHGTPSSSNPDTVSGYPYRKNGQKNELTHSACSDCHAITGRDAIAAEGTFPAMCVICHQDTRFARMGKNLHLFPNPAATQSQFFDRFSHQEHATKPKEKVSFDCASCHTPTAKSVVLRKTQFAPKVRHSLPSHAQCFVCHFNEKEVARTQVSFATNCVGCHAIKGEQAGKGSELAVHWPPRQITNPEENPTKRGEKPLKPFSHETHVDPDDKDPKSCLACHATAERAEKRSDFFLEDRQTKEKQPRAVACLECHIKEMQHKIEGALKLEASSCSYCHSLQTIKGRAATGAQLPPPNHLIDSPPATPTPKPAVKPPSNSEVKVPALKSEPKLRAMKTSRIPEKWRLHSLSDQSQPRGWSFPLSREFRRDYSP